MNTRKGIILVSGLGTLRYAFTKTTNYHSPEYERSVFWSDHALNIDWPIEGEPTLAAKDAAALMLAQAKAVSMIPLVWAA